MLSRGVWIWRRYNAGLLRIEPDLYVDLHSDAFPSSCDVALASCDVALASFLLELGSFTLTLSNAQLLSRHFLLTMNKELTVGSDEKNTAQAVGRVEARSLRYALGRRSPLTYKATTGNCMRILTFHRDVSCIVHYEATRISQVHTCSGQRNLAWFQSVHSKLTFVGIILTKFQIFSLKKSELRILKMRFSFLQLPFPSPPCQCYLFLCFLLACSISLFF